MRGVRRGAGAEGILAGEGGILAGEVVILAGEVGILAGEVVKEGDTEDGVAVSGASWML